METKQDANQELLEMLKIRVKIAEKFAENYNKDIERYHKDYNITTIKDAKFENLDNQIQIPYIFSTVESNQASMFEKFPEIIMKQRGKEDREFTEFAESIWSYLNDKIGLEEKIEDASILFLNDGQSTTRYGWDAQYIEVEMPVTLPDSGEPEIDQMGQPVMQKVKVPVKNLPYVTIASHDTITFSPESKFVCDDENNDIPYIIYTQKLEKDEVEELYPGKTVGEDELETVKIEEISKDNGLKEMTTAEANEMETDMKRVKLHHYFGQLPRKYITNKEALATYRTSNVYYTCFSKKQVYAEPTQVNKKPFLNLGNYGLPSKFYRFGEAKVLRELEQDVSLGRSRIMDLRDRQGTKIGIPTGTEFDEESMKRARDYTFLRFNGTTPPVYINPPPIPEAITDSINMSREDIQLASAMMDISRASMSNTVDTATGQKIFAGETNKRNNKKKKKISRYMKSLAKNLLVLCGQNWDVDTFAKITDLPPEVIEQQGWIQKLQELGNDYDVEINVDTLGDTKETDAANAIALFREMKDSQFINQDELTKFVLSQGFGLKDSTRFLTGNVSPQQIMAVMQNLLQLGVIQQDDAQVIVDKLDQMQQEQQMQEQGGVVGANEGRPATGNPVDIVNKSMPGTDMTQMAAQRQAAYKQTGVAKGPQNVR